MEHNTDTLILNKSGNKIINGVIYKNSINAPNILIILWGRAYDNIINDPKVQYGYKYNQEPDTYQVADFTSCLNQMNYMVKIKLYVILELTEELDYEEND